MSKRQNSGKTRIGRRKAMRMGVEHVPLRSPRASFLTSNPCPNCGESMFKDRNGMNCPNCGNPYGNRKSE